MKYVQSGIFPTRALLAVTVAVAAVANLAACASQPAATTVTAADISASPASAPKDAPAETAAPAQPAPAGKLACRSQNRDDGTLELFLDWSGETAKGVLRRTTPSGMVEDTSIQAQKFKDMIIADEPGATDLVVHAAVVAKHDGKPYIRLGDSNQNWRRCQ